MLPTKRVMQSLVHRLIWRDREMKISQQCPSMSRQSIWTKKATSLVSRSSRRRRAWTRVGTSKWQTASSLKTGRQGPHRMNIHHHCPRCRELKQCLTSTTCPALSAVVVHPEALLTSQRRQIQTRGPRQPCKALMAYIQLTDLIKEDWCLLGAPRNEARKRTSRTFSPS